jgi:hypothetical protein
MTRDSDGCIRGHPCYPPVITSHHQSCHFSGRSIDIGRDMGESEHCQRISDASAQAHTRALRRLRHRHERREREGIEIVVCGVDQAAASTSAVWST